MSLTVIIDGDIVIHRAADAVQENFEIEIEEDDSRFLYRTVIWGDKEAGKKTADAIINDICNKVKAADAVIAISSGSNFRKTINPEYKRNRQKNLKPVIYSFLRDYLKENYKIYERPNQEADDVIGILATSPVIIKGSKCVWSFDKDFKTIPCTFFRGHPDGVLEKQIITEAEADYWFMYQTLIGDVTDGYKGCKGIGSKTALKLLGKIGEKSLPEM